MKTIFYALPLLLLVSCADDDEGPLAPPAPDAERLVLVANEGGFNQATASLTIYDPEANATAQNVYYNANQNTPLGDIFQSIYHLESELYFVVNNSGKVEVVDDATYVSQRTITGLNSPRYMHFVSRDKAYITDLFANGIHIVNPSNATYKGMINTGAWMEHMLMHNGEVWTTGPGGEKVFFINQATDEIVGDITLSAGPNTLVKDTNSDVWVLCQGDFADIYPVLYRIDGITKSIETTIELGVVNGYGGSLAIDPAGEALYILIGGSVYEMSIGDDALPATPLIPAEGRNLYGLSVNPVNGNIAVTDAVDFSSTGAVHIYAFDGTSITDFEAGIVPGFVFWKE
jgi:DNA-binding beta-propeller fold protein YncE